MVRNYNLQYEMEAKTENNISILLFSKEKNTFLTKHESPPEVRSI